ncbi:MAG: NAD(P)H-dependent oxidoreductase subunit E [Gammaproteobacteria bacterium]|nr:NAD(P)H-dependent oxidoreductase subunit E [Gammaproteobacteria bacterium]
MATRHHSGDGEPEQNSPEGQRGRGGKRRRARATPKGRLVDPQALDAVRTVIGDGPLRRDLLIEYLHLIQDQFHELSTAHLAALAQMMGLAQTEVYEVATFYAHFDIRREDEPALAPIVVRVCDSLSCELAGAQALLAQVSAGAPDGVRVVTAPCMGRCASAPVAEVGHRHVDHASATAVMETLQGADLSAQIPDYESLAAYEAQGGYSQLRRCIAGQTTPDELVQTLLDSNLRGLGGAGFPTGRKWSFVRGYEGPRLMAVNADEGEPGTFKDRYYLERSPHQFLEGMLIAAWAVEAQTIYLYLRDEYPAVREILIRELARIESAGLSKHTKIELRRGAGAYICGEESSMLESIEGKRGLPRHRPPYVAEVGLFGQPTLVQNVETLFWIPKILTNGAEWFSREGRNGGSGLRSYSVSGRVKSPGVKLAPAGVTVKELIEEFCDGMLDGHQFKAYLPGGASGGILPADMGDLPLEFGTLQAHGCFVGSHAVVILSDQDNLKDAALNLMRFFEDESCGQCTPCRVGTQKAVVLMERATWDQPLLEELAQTMADTSICGLGQAAANPLLSVLKHFPEDISR